MLFLKKLASEVMANMAPEGAADGREQHDNNKIPLVNKQVVAETLFDILETIAKKSAMRY